MSNKVRSCDNHCNNPAVVKDVKTGDLLCSPHQYLINYDRRAFLIKVRIDNNHKQA